MAFSMAVLVMILSRVMARAGDENHSPARSVKQINGLITELGYAGTKKQKPKTKEIQPMESKSLPRDIRANIGPLVLAVNCAAAAPAPGRRIFRVEQAGRSLILPLECEPDGFVNVLDVEPGGPSNSPGAMGASVE